MADVIGTLIIYGDQAQVLFKKTSPGETISIRVRGTVTGMNIQSTPGYGNTILHPNPIAPCLVVEIEEVQG